VLTYMQHSLSLNNRRMRSNNAQSSRCTCVYYSLICVRMLCTTCSTKPAVQCSVHISVYVQAASLLTAVVATSNSSIATTAAAIRAITSSTCSCACLCACQACHCSVCGLAFSLPVCSRTCLLRTPSDLHLLAVRQQ
jgi:hypothetical protein